MRTRFVAEPNKANVWKGYIQRFPNQTLQMAICTLPLYVSPTNRIKYAKLQTKRRQAVQSSSYPIHEPSKSDEAQPHNLVAGESREG